MLPGALLIIPVILMYTAWSYYVFRGKVSGRAITEPDSRRQVRIAGASRNRANDRTVADKPATRSPSGRVSIGCALVPAPAAPS